jgi:hypothetical protein
MQVKTFKGYSNTKAIEVQGELTREDFIIEETAPQFSEYGESVDFRVKLTLKDEVADSIEEALPRHKSYSYRERKELEEIQKVWSRNRYFRWDYRGCKTDEQKKRKKDKQLDVAILWVAKNKEDVIDSLLKCANDDITRRADNLTREYDRRVADIMGGEHMASDFIKEHLDDKAIAQELEEMDIELQRIKDIRKQLLDDQRAKRNENMIAYLEKEGWNDEDEDNEGNQKVIIRDALRDAILKKYQKGEAFGSRFETFELELEDL